MSQISIDNDSSIISNVNEQYLFFLLKRGKEQYRKTDSVTNQQSANYSVKKLEILNI